MHGPEIVFGVLEVVLSGDPVAIQGFGVSQCQVTFVVPLRVLGSPRTLVANHCRFDLSELGSSWSHVACHFPIWTRLCGRAVALR